MIDIEYIADEILERLEHAEKPLASIDILTRLDIRGLRMDQVDAVLKRMERESLVERVDGGWRAAAAPETATQKNASPAPTPNPPADPVEPPPDIIRTHRTIQGRIIDALLASGGRATNEQLQAITGMNDKTISNTLQKLKHLGHVRRDGRLDWVLEQDPAKARVERAQERLVPRAPAPQPPNRDVRHSQLDDLSQQVFEVIKSYSKDLDDPVLRHLVNALESTIMAASCYADREEAA